MKKILYIDLDGTLVDFASACSKLDEKTLEKFKNNKEEIPGIFSLMPPLHGALEAFDKLSEVYDTYILSSAPWENAIAWAEKLLWVKHCMGNKAYKRLILSHHKELNKGDYLIDDSIDKNGADKFEGEVILFGSVKFPDWKNIVAYLVKEG